MASRTRHIKFGTDGWRAIMCDTFTFENVRLVVQAIAAYLLSNSKSERGIVVGHDARFLGERFAEEAAKVLIANGIKVYMLPDDAPTPVIAYAVTLHRTAGAVVFTASHNPPEYNGIKYIPEYGGPAGTDITKAIESKVGVPVAEGAESVDLSAAQSEGRLEIIDPREEYFHHLSSLVDFKAIAESGLKIVCDPMHGSGRHYLAEVLRANGCQVEVIRGNRDPLFGGGMPEPTASQLVPLADRVKESGSHLGLATDGDADRFGVIDSTGQYITPNQVVSLLLVHLVEQRRYKGEVVRTVATTHLVDRLAARYGLNVLETPVGFKYICEHMRQKPVIIGGEESGGLSIGGHIPEKDGVLANLLVAEMRAVWGENLSSILNRIMADVGPAVSRRIDLSYPDEKKTSLLKNLTAAPPETVAGRKVARITDIDGVKFVLEDDSWFLIRPSGTEPLLRVYVEAESEEKVQEIQDAVAEIVHQH
ncbi:MAG: phosphoglucomutase/phosphomannomutase family protein [Firmicutes bacterium]|nr:phosphoglucomutase/phosphomannomutase family protein [Bacillota bacterium]